MGVYQGYPALTTTAVKVVRMAMGKEAQGLSDTRLMGRFLELYPYLYNRLDFPIICEEHHWRKTSKRCIVAADIQTVDRLLSSKFEFEHLKDLTLPFSSFQISFPKGCQFHGIELPPALVTWGVFGDHGKNVMDPFTQEAGVSGVDHAYPEALKDKNIVSIVYKDPKASRLEMLYARASVSELSFPGILESDSMERFQEIAGSYKDSNLKEIIENEPHDKIIQYALLKIVIGIGVYHSLIEGCFLEEGIPDNKFRMASPSKSIKPRIFTFGLDEPS